MWPSKKTFDNLYHIVSSLARISVFVAAYVVVSKFHIILDYLSDTNSTVTIYQIMMDLKWVVVFSAMSLIINLAAEILNIVVAFYGLVGKSRNTEDSLDLVK